MRNDDFDDILDFFPNDNDDGSIPFGPDDKVVLAKVFMNRVEGQFAAAALRRLSIPHYFSNGNSTMFAENVMDGDRLYLRKNDLPVLQEILDDFKRQRLAEEGKEPEEDWYQQVREEESYRPYFLITFAIIIALAIAFFGLVIMVSFSN